MRVLRSAPWIVILAIISMVQFIRDAPADGIVFAMLVVVLLLDTAGVIPDIRRRRIPLPALIGCALVAATALAFTPRHSEWAGIVVVLVGIGALAVAWPGPRRRRESPVTPPVRRGGIAWAVVAVGMCLWELTSFLLGRGDEAGKETHPAVSDLLDPLLGTWPGQLAFGVLWLAAGIGLLRTAGRR